MMNTDVLGAAIGQLYFNITAPYYGLFQLGSLVAFGQVGVEIIFALKC